MKSTRLTIPMVVMCTLMAGACASSGAEKKPTPAPQGDGGLSARGGAVPAKSDLEEPAANADSGGDRPAVEAALIGFLTDLGEIMRRHPDDCQKVYDEVLAYFDQHDPSFKSATLEFKEYVSGLSEQQRRQYLQGYMKRVETIMKDYKQLGDRYREKCSEYDKKLKDALKEYQL